MQTEIDKKLDEEVMNNCEFENERIKFSKLDEEIKIEASEYYMLCRKKQLNKHTFPETKRIDR